MIDQIGVNDVANEILCVLEHFDDEFVSRIPNGVLNKLRKMAKDSSKKVIIDKSKKLNEQNLYPETKDFISILYYQYVANEEEKSQIIKVWSENEKIYQKELKEKYNEANLFEKKSMNS